MVASSICVLVIDGSEFNTTQQLHVKSSKGWTNSKFCANIYNMKRMINSYYTYKPGEFIAIYVDGELNNKFEFHIYKLKTVFTSIKQAF